MATRRSGTHIVLHDNTVEKHQEPERARAEYLRTRHGQHVASITKAFIVPRIERYDEDSGVLVFERLHEMMPIRDFLLSTNDPEYTLRQLGFALGKLHSTPPQSDQHSPSLVYPPQPGSASGNTVVVHGDFGFANIFIDNRTKLPVIIDWSIANWLPCNPADLWQSSSMDLSPMLICLFYARPFLRNPCGPPGRLATSFLSEYASTSPQTWNPEELTNTLLILAHRYAVSRRKARGILHFIAYSKSIFHLKRFAKTIG